MTRKHGTRFPVGNPPGDFPSPTFDMVAHGITIRDCFVGNQRDMAKVLDFAG